MDKFFYTDIPTWNNGTWTTTSYETREEFRNFVFSIFKEPGKYDFDETSFIFNEEALRYNLQGFYNPSPIKSRDYIIYWDEMKARCRKGVIFKNKEKTWYLTREYYMWVNFLPINNKEIRKFAFPDIRDAQYHLALYEILAELFYKHAAVLKKRQIASSYFHAAKLINQIWFEETPILKIGASLKSYVHDTWRFLAEYRNFLDENTAWYRPMNPGKLLDWQQQIETTIPGTTRKTLKGLKGVIKGTSFEQDPTAGVGGPCHRKGTLVLMETGKYKKIEDIKIGEYILGIDNIPKRVFKTFSGEDYIYKIDQIKGDSYYTTGDHKLYLINRDKKVLKKNNERITKTKDWINLTTYQKRCYVGVKNDKPLIFSNLQNTPTLDPYFLGLWLGDGYREKPGLIINNTDDPEILDYLKILSSIHNVSLNVRQKEKNRYAKEMYSVSFNISDNRIDNYFTKEFVKYNLFYNKHIPDDYLYGSLEIRLQLLAGYIDTDGYYDPIKGHFEISCKSDVLFKQLVFLCRSLGAYVKTYKSSSKEHIVNNKLIKYSETNRASIRIINSNLIPTKLPRKQGSFTRIRNIHTSPIKKITKLDIEPYYGIEVKDNLYYLEDLTITHNCTYFFHEEAGIAPDMMFTFGYMKPALKSGMITTGTFIAAGSVGDLEQCEPLRKMIQTPEANEIFYVESDLLDDRGTKGRTGLFIPEQWSMPPCVDKFGNSEVEKALQMLDEHFAKIKKDLSPEDYQLEVSQHPRNIEEAFATRSVSLFPSHLVAAQKRRIEDKEYHTEYVDLSRNSEGTWIVEKSKKIPISTFPVAKNAEDKTGVIVVYEKPDLKADWGTYYASIDPVSQGKSNTSESLCSIFVYKIPIEVTRHSGDDVKTYIEQDKIVAQWCGRFDDINETHKRLENIIEWYNAWTLVESNVPGFITHMIKQRKQKYLVPKNQITFRKDIDNVQNYNMEYGWRNTGTIFRSHILPYLVDFCKEVLDEVITEEGKVVKIIYGIERIPDKMVMIEMQQYREGLNVDRLIALGSLIAFAKVQEANRGIKKRLDTDNKKDLQKSENLYKFTNSPFRHIGMGQNFSNKRPPRNPFKNIR